MMTGVTRNLRKRGVTMVEVLISLFITVMALAGGYLIIVQSLELSRSARNHYIAVSIAKNRLERARNFEYSDLTLLAENNLVCDANGVPDPNGWFRRSTQINTNYAIGLTEITVTVKIRDTKTGTWPSGTVNQEEISSLFTEYLGAPGS